MDPGTVIDLGREALYIIFLISVPILGISMLVGLLISIFQATTQIQEQTLTFVPKIFAVFITLLIFGSWMINIMVQYTTKLYLNINNFIK